MKKKKTILLNRHGTDNIYSEYERNKSRVSNFFCLKTCEKKNARIEGDFADLYIHIQSQWIIQGHKHSHRHTLTHLTWCKIKIDFTARTQSQSVVTILFKSNLTMRIDVFCCCCCCVLFCMLPFFWWPTWCSFSSTYTVFTSTPYLCTSIQFYSKTHCS